jgi:hypothetical protein
MSLVLSASYGGVRAFLLLRFDMTRNFENLLINMETFNSLLRLPVICSGFVLRIFWKVSYHTVAVLITVRLCAVECFWVYLNKDPMSCDRKLMFRRQITFVRLICCGGSPAKRHCSFVLPFVTVACFKHVSDWHMWSSTSNSYNINWKIVNWPVILMCSNVFACIMSGIWLVVIWLVKGLNLNLKLMSWEAVALIARVNARCSSSRVLKVFWLFETPRRNVANHSTPPQVYCMMQW